MCGITGFCDFTKTTSKETLVKMTDILHHRGPDDSGYDFHINESAHLGLGHRRLSILDLSSHGHQPMNYQDIEIIFNGEVYNFNEIKLELQEFGYSFESHSDTEVILKAYHKWGLKAIDKFNGMFAIALFEKKRQVLTLIRDRAGVKPLYYYSHNNLFMFASELKSFHQHPHFIKELDQNGIVSFFQYGYILEPYTIFQYTQKLKAGHYIEINLETQQIKETKYWDVVDAYNEPKLDISFEEAKKQTKILLKSSCGYRMVSDVPVGIFLSGGYDSCAVAAILQNENNEKLKTFTIGFHENKYNEAHYAKDIAKYLGTDHTEYYCSTKDALEILPLLPEIWDEPFADSSVIPTTLVSRLAREHVTVSLSADGGDELFGGYNKYIRAKKYYDIINKLPFRNQVANFLHLGSFINIRQFNTLITFLHSKSHIDIMQEGSKFFSDKEVEKLLTFKIPILQTSFDDKNDLNNFNDGLSRMMAIDYKTYQSDDILVKVDRATMSTSLEGREPLLDFRLVEFVSKLPNEFKLHEGDRKFLLKSIVHDYIPKEMMDRPKKGFGIPLTEWFGDDLKKYILDYLEPDRIEKAGIFNVHEVQKLKQAWLLNGSNINQLWHILIFMMWYEKWV